MPVYYDYFSRRIQPRCCRNTWLRLFIEPLTIIIHSTLAEQEMNQVQSEAVALRKSVIRFTGKQVLPVYLEQLFKYCYGVSFVSTATLEDLDVFTGACVEYKNELKHAATTIQCAFRVPPTASSAKLSLWKRLYQEKIKSVDEEERSSLRGQACNCCHQASCIQAIHQLQEEPC